MIDPAYPDSDEEYEHVFAAVFALADKVVWGPDGEPTKFKMLTKSRRLKLFNEVPSESQPALYQTEHDEDELPKTGTGGKTILGVSWFIYFTPGGDPSAVPTITANRIMGAVRRALRPITADPGFYDRRNSLGGLVYSVRVEGKVFKDPGDIDNQGLLIVPIRIIMP